MLHPIALIRSTFALTFLAAAAWTAADAGASPAATCRPPAELARALLEGDAGWGGLEVEAFYGLDEASLERERLRASAEVRLGGGALRALANARARALCFSLVLDVEDELPVAHHRRVELAGDAGALGLRYGFDVDLPEAVSQLLVIVEEPASGLLGAAIADDAGEVEPPGAGAVRLAGAGAAAGAAWLELVRPAPAAAEAPIGPTVVRLVPPREQPVSGTARFDALVSTTAVERVAFLLDGREVASRKRTLLARPFAARIDLADPPRVQTVAAVAFDREGRELGRDEVRVNEVDAPFRVRILELAGDPAAGAVEVAAEVTVPLGAELDHLEVYRNTVLVGRFDRPSVRVRVPTPGAGPEDYVRVAATLADGSSIDDVALLAAPLAEEVDVNLVELHVVVTDASGQPVGDLRPDDFRILHRGEAQPPRSFAYADDVTLLLGVVIDTSGSMQLVMHDTRKAAAKFLGSTVLPQDRAFLVDFDLQPRLLHPTTSDLPRLLRDLSRLEADGATALYDAIVFSMLQFEREAGRKALVILSDGDDHESRFGPGYCVELARQTGVPVYIIGLGALDTLRRTYSKKDLRKVTSETGGQLWFVDSLDELDAAYAQINAELRSQYSLSFYADGDLGADELRDVSVEIRRPGLSARTVVGGRRRQTAP